MAPLQQTQLAPEALVRPAWRRLLPVLVLVAVAWFGVHWLTRDDHASLAPDQAPLLQLQAFDGSQIDLAALAGQPVVVNFWASWCEPCRAEAELFEAAWRAENQTANSVNNKDRRGIVFIGVNHQDTLAGATAFLKEFDLTYPNGVDITGEWSRAFGVPGLPSTYFINAEGQIKAVVWGPITGRRELAQQLEKIRLK